jgi:hypothetical protein
MDQVEVRLSRKPNKIGERTDARIILKIQMDSACTCCELEMTIKLVNRMTLITAHMVRATNMRMIICFMVSFFRISAFCSLSGMSSLPEQDTHSHSSSM